MRATMHSITDRQTDRQTDGRTDGRQDDANIADHTVRVAVRSANDAYYE